MNSEQANRSVEHAKMWILNWVKKTPFITKSLIYICIGGSVLSLFYYLGLDFNYYFSNLPQKTVFDFQIYRVLTSWLFPSSFIGGAFQIFSLHSIFSRIETKRGSVYLLVNMLVLNTVSQIIFVILCTVLGIIIRPLLWHFSVGMWVIFFNLLPIVLADPSQPENIPIFLVKVPRVVFPFIVCFLFQFFGFSLDIVVGVIVGHYAQYKYKFLELSHAQIRSIEMSDPIRHLRAHTSGFVVSDIADYNGLPQFVPFVGENHKAGGSSFSSMSSNMYVEDYMPHAEKHADRSLSTTSDDQDMSITKEDESLIKHQSNNK